MNLVTTRKEPRSVRRVAVFRFGDSQAALAVVLFAGAAAWLRGLRRPDEER